MIRRLGPGDEGVLAVLAVDEADFDLEDTAGLGSPSPARTSPRISAIRRFYAGWPRKDGIVVGHLLAYPDNRPTLENHLASSEKNR